jgi:two-component system, sensor histidine kinase and response regulator
VKLSRLNYSTIALCLVLALLDGLGFLFVNHLSGLRQLANERQFTANQQGERFLEGVVYLSDQARAFVATGSPRYERNYREEAEQHQRILQAADSLRRIGLSPEEQALIDQAYEQALVLGQIELLAIEERQLGNLQSAIDLVFGPAHDDALVDIQEPLRRLRTRLDARLAAELHDAGRQLQQARVAQLGLILLNALLLTAVLGYYYQRRVIRPLSEMTEQVQAMKAGLPFRHLASESEPSEVGELAHSLVEYSATREQMAQDQWVKSQQARIATLLQSCTSYSELAQRFLTEVCPLLEVGHAVFYVVEEDRHQLRLIAQFAHSERKGLAQRFAIGEGLVGQCALERATIQITRPPADYLRIQSSLGEMAPAAIIALPVLSGGQVLAVIELAALNVFGLREESLLEGLLPMLAMSLEILERNVRTQRLLEATQVQANELARQKDEIESQRRSITVLLDEQNAIFGRERQPRQERIPGQHEPRDPHADERRAGPHRTAARDAAGHPAAALRRQDAQLGRALLSIINDILDFSKIEAGKLETESLDFDLYQSVEDVVQLLAPRAHAKNLELACRIDEACPPRCAATPTGCARS